MYPRFLFNQDKAIYIKINSALGDSLIINHHKEEITTGNRSLATKLDRYSTDELISEGWIGMDQKDFNLVCTTVLNRVYIQIIK